MPPRRSTTKSTTPSRSSSRSQSKGRGSASPRASAQTAKRASASLSPRRSTSGARGSAVLASAQTPLHQEMRQVEAILANRRGKNGAPPPTHVGPSTTERSGWGYWASIVLMELLVVVWCCWAYDLYTNSVSSTK